MRPLIFGSDSSSVVVSSNVYDQNIWVLAGSPSQPVQLVYTVAAGTTIGGTTSLFSLRTGAFPLGSTLTLVNRGSIYGKAGGGVENTSGGTAIYLDYPMTIDNQGFIFGGGGAGATGVTSTGPERGGAGGGGAGQGHAGNVGLAAPTGLGVDGQNGGSSSAAGYGVGGAGGINGVNRGGDGGSGGFWATNGNPSAENNFGQVSNSFGLAGAAVSTNGHALVWISGLTSAKVKGAIV